MTAGAPGSLSLALGGRIEATSDMTHKTFAGFREGGLQRHREDRAAVQFDAPVTPLLSTLLTVIACVGLRAHI